MSLFTQILDKLGLKKEPAESTSTGGASTNKPAPSMPGSRPGAVANPAPSSPATRNAAEAARAPTAVSEVDVVKKLEQMSAGKGLNWKTSIVDLLKFLDLDSSREARTELAKELNAPAEVMNDSA